MKVMILCRGYRIARKMSLLLGILANERGGLKSEIASDPKFCAAVFGVFFF